MARVTGLEPATSGVTGRRSNQLSYTRLSGSPKRGALFMGRPIFGQAGYARDLQIMQRDCQRAEKWACAHWRMTANPVCTSVSRSVLEIT